LRTYRVSQGPPVNPAIPVAKPGAQPVLLGGHAVPGPARSTRPGVALALTGVPAAGVLPRPQARMWPEPRPADRTGLLLHGLLAEALIVVLPASHRWISFHEQTLV